MNITVSAARLNADFYSLDDTTRIGILEVLIDAARAAYSTNVLKDKADLKRLFDVLEVDRGSEQL